MSGSPSKRRLAFFASTRHVRRKTRVPLLEQLEARQVLSTILWTNRGDNGGADTDNFEAVYGAATAPIARSIVDRAINDWEEVIVAFNYPGGGNTYTLEISAADLGGGGRGVTFNINYNAAGQPFDAEITMDDNGGGAGWYFDPNIADDAEFTTLLNSFTANGPNALGGNDFYRTILHEIGHAVGILIDGPAAIMSFLGAPGPEDPNAPGSGDNLFLFTGPSVIATLTETGGGHIYEGPAVTGFTTHPFDLLNAGRTVGFPPPTRELITDLNALILHDAYGYTVKLPSKINTFYANFNSTNGALTVNGAPGISNDQIVIDRSGGVLRVVVNETEEIFDAVNVLSINVLAGAGNDHVTIGSSVGIPATVNGEDGNDTLIGGDVVLLGGPGDDYLYGSSGPDTLDGGAGNDQLYGLDGDDVLTGGPDDDLIIAGKGKNTIVQAAGDGNDIVDLSENAVAITYTVVAGNDTVIGTPYDDTITGGAGNDRLEGRGGRDVLAGGGGTNRLLGGDEADTFNITGSDTVDGGDGDDRFQLQTGAGLTVTIDGGDPSNSDVLILNAAAAAETLTINPNSTNPTRVDISSNLGGTVAVTSVELIQYEGQSADDTLVVSPGPVGRSRVQNSPDDFRGRITSDTLPPIEWNDLDTFRLQHLGVKSTRVDTFVLEDLFDAAKFEYAALADTLIIEGGATDNLWNVVRSGSDISITSTTGSGVRALTVLSSGFPGQIRFDTQGGADTLTVDNSGGLVTVPLQYNGGDGNDSLRLIGTTGGVTAAYSVGPGTSDGTITHVLGAATQTVVFTGLEPVLDTVGGTLAINATNADNAINYTQGSVAANGLIAVDAFETYEFSNKTTLTINGLAGSDTINLNNPSTPTGLTSITVSGGDPTAGDTVIVNGTVGADTIQFRPTAADSGTMQVNALPLVALQTVEHLTINGRGGNDSLSVITPNSAAVDIIRLTPGSAADAGRVQVQSTSLAAELLPLDFQNLGTEGGQLTFVDGAPGHRRDALIYRGTSGDDFFMALAGLGGEGEIQLFSRLFYIPVFAPGVNELTLDGLAGSDNFNINALADGPLPFGAISLYGGDPATGSDNAALGGTGQAASVARLGSSVIIVTSTGITAGFVQIDGMESVHLFNDDGPVTLNGLDVPVVYDVTPISTRELVIRSGADAPVLGIFTDGSITLNEGTAADSDILRVRGTAAGESIVVGPSSVQIGALKTINFNPAFVEAIEVFGNQGNDAFNVTPGIRPIFIDGGDPIGTIPGDSLHVNGAVGFFAGPENDEGGYLTPGQTVSFDHIESLSVTPDPDCPFLIVGTDADDDITVIARDASTHAGADGVQDFTFTINAGPELLVLNAPDLFIDAKSGDDDIVIRAPAPNDASWGVDVRVTGGPPSIGQTNEADRLVLETPGRDNLVFSPTGPDTGSLLVDEANDGGFTPGTDTRVTFGSFTFVCDQFTYRSSSGGVELIEYDGQGAPLIDDAITIHGNFADETTTVSPQDLGTGTFVSTNSPRFVFRSFEQLTVNGNDGVDQLIFNATQGPDTITSTGNALTLNDNLTHVVAIGVGIDQLNVNTFDGDDNINLDLTVTPLKKVIDAGAGNDLVDLSGSVDADIFGGSGDDTLIGSPAADNIFGGAGNDVIIGGGGNDVAYGEEGNDVFGNPSGAPNGVADDPGNDQFFGGAGSDLFVWEPGDSSDLVEGGAGDGDELRFIGNAGNNRVEIFGGGGNFVNPAFPGVAGDASRAIIALNSTAFLTAAVFVDTADVEAIHVDLLGGTDELIINNQVPNTSTAGSFLQSGTDLGSTHVRSITGDLGSGDGVVDRVEVHGRLTADDINIRSLGTNFTLGPVDVAGLGYSIAVNQSVGGVGGDLLVVRGQTGNDSIKAQDGTEVRINIQLNGDEGDDFLSGDAVLNGGAGDDFLKGGSGADTLNGGPGEDTLVGGGGSDTFDGGPDFDTILVAGTSGNDTIAVNQSDAVTLVTTLNGAIDSDALVTVGGVRTVERVRIEAGAGDDVILLKHADGLGLDGFLNSVIFDVDGGPAATRDRLSVQDDATSPGALGDLVLYRKAESNSAGSITVGPGNGEPLESVFTNVEFVQPLAGAGGQLLVFKHDPLENNDERINATHLGAGTLNVDPTIDPGPLDPGVPGFAPLPGDQDWYRIVAEKTGTLDIQVFFTMITTVASGRPGLPASGDLQIELYDADGTLIVDGVAGGVVPEFGLNDATDDERIRIPAVEGQIYFLRVLGTGTAINSYNITVVNTAAPVPFDLELDDVIATSAVAGAPAPTAISFAGGAALPAVDDFFNGKDVVFTSGPLNGQRGRVVDYVGATRQFVFALNTFTGAPAVGNTFQIEGVDTGRSHLDNITRDNTPTIFLRVPDSALLNDIPDNNGNPGVPPDEVIVIPFVTSTANDAPVPGFRVAIFRTENNTHTHVGYAQPVTGSPGVYSFTFPSPIPDGSHFLSARVEMIDPALPQQAQGFGAFAPSLEIVVDTQVPPVFFGLPNDSNDGLLPGSDSGVNTNPETLNDLVTNVTNPGFFGQAEANAVIRLFIDAPQAGFPTGNGLFEPAIDFQIGFDVVEPLDGTNQYPTGYWQVDAVNVNLNAPPFSPIDGLRRIFVTAEDVAGNINAIPPAAVQELKIFIDTQGPQITDVEINNVGHPYDLFDPKPSTDGPTPLVESLVLSIQDLPLRTAEFLVAAIKDDIADNPGHYLVKGDYNGIIPIQDVVVTLVASQPARATIELVFWLPGPDGQFHTADDLGAPLPDDRFTLFVSDRGIIDRAGNKLDGESNADEPHDQDAPFPDILGVDGVPTGDGLPGGDFVARFTIDSRPEVGTWGAGSAWIDTNGNSTFDPDNEDFTNRDINYILGFTSDDLFAGNFALNAGDVADRFDKLAAYGRGGTAWRWLIDTDNDGVPNINQIDPAGINGLPFAGNFDGNAANGDEVGVFTGSTWWFDTNHDFRVDFSIVAAAGFTGYPVVGDFDGDSNDDLGAWTNDTFRFNLSSTGGTINPLLPGLNGAIEDSFRFGFPSTNERPVAADLNQDGYEDIGLFVPNRTGVPHEVAEWYLLVSGPVQNNDPTGPLVLGPSILDRIVSDPIDGANVVRFTPVPFGRDLYLQYGDRFSLPLLGNFDPPVAGGSQPTSPGNNFRDPLDVNNDGFVSAIDALLVINDLNGHGGGRAVPRGGFNRAPFLDVNNDQYISAIDGLMVINHLNSRATGGPEPEGEGDFFASLDQMASQTTAEISDDLLALLADDQDDRQRRRRS